MSNVDTKNYIEGGAQDSNIAANDIYITNNYHNPPEPPQENPTPTKSALSTFLTQHWKKSLMAITVPIVSAFVWHTYFSDYANQLEEAQSYMNMGMYAEAQTDFQQAITQYPFNHFLDVTKAADWGLEKTNVFISKKRTVIEKKLQQFEKHHPNDADVQVLYGKLFLTFKELDNAEKYYKKAITLNPENAEAHAGVCEIYDLKNNPQAIAECEAAIKATKISPPDRYKINLAALYAQNYEYPKALQTLGELEEKYLLVKFERARLLQITQQLTKAEKLFEQVWNGLNNSTIVNQMENQENWYFKADKNPMTLHKLEDKKCYAGYSYAAALYLNNKANKGQEQLQKLTDICGDNEDIIKQQLLFDLNLAQENGLPAQAVMSFKTILSQVDKAYSKPTN